MIEFDTYLGSFYLKLLGLALLLSIVRIRVRLWWS